MLLFFHIKMKYTIFAATNLKTIYYMRKILCFAALLLSCVTQGHAQYFDPVLLDAETAQEHIKASKKKIVTHNTRDLMSASESDTWTDGEKYYTGWPDGNKYQIFYSKEPGDIASTPIKELVARALHAQSPRAARPIVTVNCAALAENLLESELFGHERGAFTGAERRREGRFKQADGGTLFLDEIGEMPISLQAKLLRALQQGEVQRLGSDQSEHVDVRVIAATNRDLKKEVAERRFREDLYFRLNVISIDVPPLRRRTEDIPLLAAHFLARFAERNRKTVRGFSPQAMNSLLHYAWPGNVRELENAVERAVILCTGDLVTGKELPLAVAEAEAPEASPGQQQAQGGQSLAGLPLDEVERMAIEDTLKLTRDNKSEAARSLGITRATLHNKMRKYEIGKDGGRHD